MVHYVRKADSIKRNFQYAVLFCSRSFPSSQDIDQKNDLTFRSFFHDHDDFDLVTFMMHGLFC